MDTPQDDSTPQKVSDPPYPESWEADVILRDGRPVRLRPIRPDDAQSLRDFHARLSPETVYFRFFAPRPELSDAQVEHLTTVDYRDRVALVAMARGDIIGVGRFESIDDTSAEVAFVIEDAHQGRGLGSLLLEHLAAIGRETGKRRFVAEVLPQNGRMLSTFTEAGYKVDRAYDEGVVSLGFDLTMTADMLKVMDAREHRGEARSLEKVMRPASVAVVGASREPGSIGHELLRHLVSGGFNGRIHAVNREGGQVLGFECSASLQSVGRDVDLALVAVPDEALVEVVTDAATVGVRGLVIVTDPEHGRLARRREVVAAAREGGMRIIGPAALGIINTDPEVRLNASLAPEVPRRDSIGFFCQSGALGIDILARVQRRGLGVSSFVSAGNRADVSGNDLLQFWEEDDDTDVIMLYLESMGNVGKFLRLARRIGRNKPIVTLRTTGAMSVHPLGHDVPVSHLQEKAREQLFAASGIIDAGSLDEMLDIAEVLRLRGLPEGNRLGLVGNDSAVATLARNAAEESGLRVEAEPWLTGRVSTADRYRRLLDEAARDPSVDAILAFYVPPVESAEDVRIREVLATVAASIEKPTVAVVVGVSASAMRSEAADGARTGAGLRSLPVFTDVEHATRALGTLAAYAAWRDAEPGTFGDLHPLPTDMLEDWPDTEGQEMSGAQALAALGKLGLPVAAASDGSAAQASCVLIATVDPLVGPVLMFGLDDEVTSLLDEYAFAVAPLTQQDAHRMLDGLKTLPLLRERAGSAGLDALAAFLARVGDIVVESPGPVRIECRPLLVGEKGPVITTASIRGLSDELGPTWQARRLGR